MNRKNLKFMLISIVISLVALIIIMAPTINYKSLIYLSKIDYFYIGLALVFHAIYFFLWAARIKILTGSLNAQISYRAALKIVLVNIFAATITPASVGGEPVRIKMLMDNKFSSGDATAIVVGERITDAMFLLSVAPLLFFISSKTETLGITYFIYGAVMIFAFLIILVIVLVAKYEYISRHLPKLDRVLKLFIKKWTKRKKFIGTLKREYSNFHFAFVHLFARRKKNAALVYIITGAMWISDFIIFSIVLLAFGQNPIWIYSIFAQILIVFASALPITPGGSGVVEFVTFAMYAMVVPMYLLGLIILIWRGIVFYFNIILGMIFTTHYFMKHA